MAELPNQIPVEKKVTLGCLGALLLIVIGVAIATSEPAPPPYTAKDLEAKRVEFAKEAKEGKNWKPRSPASVDATDTCHLGEYADNPNCETEGQMLADQKRAHIQRCLNNPNGWFCGDVNSQPHIYVIRPMNPDDH